MDTIFALATAPGRSGVAVIRVSGPQAIGACVSLAGPVPEPRRLALRVIRSREGEVVDQGLVVVFPGPESFTGEDVVEFHLHGSIAVISAVLRVLGSIDGLRLAEAGEFTRRALENGRLDLTQVEALADLIDAETEAQRLQALDNLSGRFAEQVGVWRRSLVRAAALLEAVIDFADEEVPEDVSAEVAALLGDVSRSMSETVRGSDAAERVRVGFEVAIVGPPNAGKSTLLNRLAGREAAITSEHAGTTRDVIEVRMDIGGLAVTLLDTAGLRETDDVVESIGVNRARERAETADLRVHLVAEGEGPLIEVKAGDVVRRPKQDHGGDNGVSGLTGAGIDGLLDAIRVTLAARTAGAGLANRQRHVTALRHGIVHLELALERLRGGPDLYDVTSEEVRVALRQLECLVGHVDVEHLLDEIFSSFCVGK